MFSVNDSTLYKLLDTRKAINIWVTKYDFLSYSNIGHLVRCIMVFI